MLVKCRELHSDKMLIGGVCKFTNKLTGEEHYLCLHPDDDLKPMVTRVDPLCCDFSTSPTEDVGELVEALEHIIEYWNRRDNDTAMNDALYHMIETAEQAIAKFKKENE